MAPTDAQLRKIFAAFDTDGSGKIDMTELRLALGKAGKKSSPEEVKKIVDLVDKDNDGEIDFECVHLFALDPRFLPLICRLTRSP